MKIQALMACAALAVPVTLAGQSTNHPSSPIPSPAVPSPANPGQNHPAQLSKHDRLFLHAIASEDQSEIELAQLALQKSTNPQVQQYAKTKILAADPSMKQQAEQIAQQNHSPVTSSPSPVQKAEYKNLARLSGKLFDQAYMKYEGRQQSADLKVVKNEITTARNSQVSQYAQKEETPVQQAAQAAQHIASSLHVSKIS